MTDNTDRKTGKPWLPALEALRGLAFLCVFLEHAGVLHIAAGGVSLFFVLSGFLLAYRDRGETLDCSPLGCLRFAVRRIRKLYLLYLLTTVYFLVLTVRSMRLGALPNAGMGSLAVQVGLSVPLLQSWAPYDSIYFSLNGAAWFLSDLMFMYAVTPLILTALRRLSARGLLRALLFTFAAYCAYSFLAVLMVGRLIPLYMKNWFLYIAPPYRLGDYLIGCCLGFLFPYAASMPVSRRGAVAAELAALAFAALTILMSCLQAGFLRRIGLGSTLSVLPAAAMLAFFVALDRGGMLSWLNNPLTRFLGGISASAFLIHTAVLITFRRVFARMGLQDAGNPLYIFGGLAVTILLSLAWNALQARFGRGKPARG